MSRNLAVQHVIDIEQVGAEYLVYHKSQTFCYSAGYRIS